MVTNNNRTKTEVKAQADYTEANKQLKRSIRVDKQNYVKDSGKLHEKEI